MLYLFIWFSAATFTYGFGIKPNKKPSCGEQASRLFILLFAWPLILGSELRDALRERK